MTYILDGPFIVTPLSKTFVDQANAGGAIDGLKTWEINVAQDIANKSFPPFG